MTAETVLPVPETGSDRLVGLDAFLDARSIAVVGVSASGRGLGNTTLFTLQHAGFAGRLVAVNPRAEEIRGVPCYPSLAAIPHPVDLALLFTSGERLKATLADAATAGIGAAVLFASGFSESGADGLRLQQEVVDLARAAGVRLLGPNCQGVITAGTGMAATFSNAVLAADIGPAAPVAYVGQSGAIGGVLFDLGRERGCPPAVWVSTGNQADVGAVEMAAHVLRRDDVQLIMIYLEDLPPAHEWTALCRQAQDLGKQLVVLRSGTTDAGRRAVASHTGALIGRDEAFVVVSEAHGVLSVTDVNEMIDVARCWVAGLADVGPRMAVVTTSGGAGGLAADLGSRAGLQMATFGPGTVAALGGALSEFATAQNPLDVTADLVASRPGDLGPVCRIVADDPAVDQVLVVLSAVVGRPAEAMAASIVAAAPEFGAPLAVVYLCSHDRTREVRQIFAVAGIPVFDSLSTAVSVLGRLARPATTEQELAPVEPGSAGGTRVVTEAAGAAHLHAAGIGIPASALVTTRADAEAVAATFTGELVVKLESPDIVHKTEHGLVRIRVAPQAVGELFDELVAGAQAAVPGARIEGVLLQEMAGPGVELLVGVQVQDSGYPPVLTVGIGGVAVELYADVATSVLPIDPPAALLLLRRLRGWPLLDGYRGRPAADVGAAARVLTATSELVTALGPRLREFEINPLIVHPAGAGATAVDFVAHLDLDPAVDAAVDADSEVPAGV